MDLEISVGDRVDGRGRPGEVERGEGEAFEMQAVEG